MTLTHQATIQRSPDGLLQRSRRNTHQLLAMRPPAVARIQVTRARGLIRGESTRRVGGESPVSRKTGGATSDQRVGGDRSGGYGVVRDILIYTQYIYIYI